MKSPHGPSAIVAVRYQSKDIDRAIQFYGDTLDFKLEHKSGAHFRNTVEEGPGGKQIQVEDPDGNPIELHEGGAGATK